MAMYHICGGRYDTRLAVVGAQGKPWESADFFSTCLPAYVLREMGHYVINELTRLRWKRISMISMKQKTPAFICCCILSDN